MPRPATGTRQKLIDTATDLIWTASYGSVSVDDICKAANVKKGSFYHYFPSKLDLAATVLLEYFDSVIEPDLKRIFAANAPFARQIELLADAIIEEQATAYKKYKIVCGCPLAVLACELTGQNHDMAERIGGMFERAKHYLRNAIDGAIANGDIPPQNTHEKADELHDFITGLTMMARVNGTLDGLHRDLKNGMFRIFGLAEQDPDKKIATYS